MPKLVIIGGDPLRSRRPCWLSASTPTSLFFQLEHMRREKADKERPRDWYVAGATVKRG